MVRNKWFWLVPFIIVFAVFGVIGMAHIFAPSWIGEKAVRAGYLQKTVGLITDAPHATAELFYSSIENIVILAVINGIPSGFASWNDSK